MEVFKGHTWAAVKAGLLWGDFRFARTQSPIVSNKPFSFSKVAEQLQLSVLQTFPVILDCVDMKVSHAQDFIWPTKKPKIDYSYHRQASKCHLQRPSWKTVSTPFHGSPGTRNAGRERYGRGGGLFRIISRRLDASSSQTPSYKIQSKTLLQHEKPLAS